MKIKYRLPTFGLITMLLLVACQLEREPAIINTPLATVTNTVKAPLEPTLTLLRPTTTKVIEIETMSTPVNVSTASATAVLETAASPSAFVTPTITAVTLTPLPTLAADDLAAAVAELLANPMNCEVPCWWGAIPGVTSLDEITHAVSPYNFHMSEYAEDEEVIYLLLEMEYVEDQANYEIGIVYNFSQSILIGITAYSPSIFEVLARFGHPDGVWLLALNDPREDHPTVWLNMVYLQKGMAVGYVVDADIQGDMVKGCFANEETGRLRLIEPDNAISYQEFSPIFGQDRLYLPLGEAANLTIGEFMQRFSDPAQPQCIEMPAELWE